MNKKSYLIWGFLGFLIVSAGLYAVDNVGSGSGVVREMSACRWLVTRVAATSSNLGVTVTSSIKSQPGIIRRIVLIPGQTNDLFYVYDSSVANQAAAAEVFLANHLTNGLFTAGLPVFYEFPEGLNCTNQISVLLRSSGVTTNISRLFISYDQNR